MSKTNPFPGRTAPSARRTRQDETRASHRLEHQHDQPEAEANRQETQERQDRVNEHPFELRHEVKRLNTRLDSIAETLEKSQMKDMIENYTSPKKRIIANLSAGLARGLGLTLGTALVLGLLGYILSLFVDIPMIGDLISDLKGYVEQSK